MTTSHSVNPGVAEAAQGGLFSDEEPKPNSPEDLGQAPTIKPPQYQPRKPALKTPPEFPENFSPHAIKVADVRKFLDWAVAQGFDVHEKVGVGSVLVALSGMVTADLHWLCKAIRQVKRVPMPATMARAVKARDVHILRPGGDRGGKP